jgi:CHRD domain
MNINSSTLIIAFVATALIFATLATIRPQPTLAALSATATTGPGKSAAQQQAFTATMTGSEEVPPKNTKATGTATFVSGTDGSSVAYKIRVTNIKGVTMAHIHSGNSGKNGPIVVSLFKSASPPTGTMNGLLSQGTITSANLEGPLKGKTISDLIRLINDGTAYANVHTEQNPKGEIRGQISTSASASASTSAGNSASASASAGY